MKFLNYFPFLILLIHFNIFCQKTIDLKYNPGINQIEKPNSLDLNLKRQESYIFKINGLNDAYHGASINAEYLKRIVSVPEILKPIIPNIGADVGKMKFMYSTIKANILLDSNRIVIADSVQTPPVSELTEEQKFIKALEDDYLYLQASILFTSDLIRFLDKHWDNADSCHIQAELTVTYIKAFIPGHLIDPLNRSHAISLNNGDLTLDTYNQTLNDVSISLRSYQQSISSGNDLHYITNAVMDDFLTRITQISSDHFLPRVGNNQLAIYLNANKFILENKDMLTKSSVIIQKIQDCKLYVQSKSYSPQGDYLRFKTTVLENQFLNKPDTLFHQEMDFYKVGYLKVDFSGGFFYNTLASQSYYYTDSAGNYSKEKNYNADVAVGALGHLYFVADSRLKIGACLGAGISLLDAKAKYFLGPSILLGRKTEFAISGGLAAASLPHVSAVTSDAKFSIDDLSKAVPTYNKFTFGYFIGISYTFIKN